MTLSEKPSSHVIVNGVVSLYTSKAPFHKSGRSIHAALEYNPIDDTIKCHECGQWRSHLSSHLIRHHGFSSVREYKLKHGLKIKTVLVGERTRLKLVRRQNMKGTANLLNYRLTLTDADIKKMVRKRIRTVKRSGIRKRHQLENRNSKGKCNLQLLSTIKKLSEQVGHTPTSKELFEVGINHQTLAFRFGSTKRAMRLVGLTPNKPSCVRKFSTRQLLENLKQFSARFNRSPSASDSRRGLLICETSVFVRRFGSWNKALKRAGLEMRPQGRGIVSKWGRPVHSGTKA